MEKKLDMVMSCNIILIFNAAKLIRKFYLYKSFCMICTENVVLMATLGSEIQFRVGFNTLFLDE